MAVVGGTPASRSLCRPRWHVVPSPKTTGRIASLVAASPTDVWAAGSVALETGLIEHWNGHSWRILQKPSATDIRDVAVIAPNDVWAVGLGVQGGFAEHWDGIRWTPRPPPGSETSLWAADGDTPDDVWAVGTDENGLLILRWNGSVWQPMPTPSAPPSVTNGPLTTFSSLTGVAVLAKNDVWVAGTRATGSFRGEALTAHWDGTGWRLVNPPAGVRDLGTFAVISSTDIWAVTGQRGRGDVIHWDGVRWRTYPHPEMDGPVSDISAISRNDVWLVNPVMHWNGRKWSGVRRASGFDVYQAIAAVSAQDVWVARSVFVAQGPNRFVFEHYSCTNATS